MINLSAYTKLKYHRYLFIGFIGTIKCYHGKTHTCTQRIGCRSFNVLDEPTNPSELKKQVPNSPKRRECDARYGFQLNKHNEPHNHIE
jgi:hypothetical protein